MNALAARAGAGDDDERLRARSARRPACGAGGSTGCSMSRRCWQLLLSALTAMDMLGEKLQVREVARGGVEPPTFRFSVGRSYQLSYLAGRAANRSAATPTGLEPATSAVTGRRANQLRYGASMVLRPVSPTGFEPALPP